ncbi:dehydrogenase [Rothia sp. LK2588]|uniref:dehydrogenase n=1 Tax=Rothia sp. LK2588 TaxID=3114369 RepID=UPI0034CDA856
MGLKDFLQSRRDDAELGRGVWRRANDRFNRGIDRFHQILQQLPDDRSLELVVPEANRLADMIEEVRTICRRAQTIAPSAGTDMPYSPTGVYSDLHRSLSKAGNAVALCAEALAMTRVASDDAAQQSRQAVMTQRVDRVAEHLEDAERLVSAAEKQHGGAH